MNAARMLFAGMLGIGLLAAQAHAQDTQSGLGAEAQNATQLQQPQEAPPQLSQHALSNWITYHDKTYNGELGGPNGSPPIGTELFLRSGPSAPIGPGVFPRVLDVGWMIEGGGRALFFDSNMKGAWAIEASLSNNYNYAPANSHDILVEGKNVTVHSLNRTFVNLGLGRDWCLASPMDGHAEWNFGIDSGVRYGTGRVAFYELHNRTSLLTGAYAAMHTDLQIPYGCFIFEIGLAAEWSYTHSYEFLQVPNDMQDINLLVNFGVRY